MSDNKTFAEKRMELLEKIAICVEKSGEPLVLCGGMAAFLICEMARSEAQVVFTEDADLLIRRRRAADKAFAESPVTVAKVMVDEGFHSEPTAFPIAEAGGRAGEKWKTEELENLYVEFLTHDHEKEKHRISGITAQGLSYFSMSLENTFLYTLPSKRQIQVVAPDAFIMHKALTFPMRSEKKKAIKDLYYISFIGKNSYRSPGQIKEDILLLPIVNGWRKTAHKNIAAAAKNLPSIEKAILMNDESRLLTAEDLKAYLEPSLFEQKNDVPTVKSKAKICGVCGKFHRAKKTEGAYEGTCATCRGLSLARADD